MTLCCLEDKVEFILLLDLGESPNEMGSNNIFFVEAYFTPLH